MGKLVLVVITDLVTIRTVNEDIQVEVVPTEGVSPAESEFRQWRTDICTVVCINLSIGHAVRTAKILVLDIAYPYGAVLCIDTVYARMNRCGGILNILFGSIVTITNVTIETEQ